jgi:hypothetical protein
VGSFNWDMIGWSGSDPLPADLILYANNNLISQAMANKVAEAVTTYLPGAINPVVTINPSMSSSDHGPFWNAGWAAICGIEEIAWGPDFNPYYHSVNDLMVNTDQTYAVNCTRAAIAALADYAIPVTTTGPVLTVQSKVIDDVGGNGNGIPDPGEQISLAVTLVNAGNQAATSIVGTLSSSSPYLTITQATTTFPNLGIGGSGPGAQPYLFTVSSSCPANTWINTTLTVTAAGGYTHTNLISFLVGDPLYSPIGPDAYGYFARDSYDPEGPAYNWIEIDPNLGGPGIPLNFTADDQTLPVALPFTFRYYGQNFGSVSINTNGWVAMGSTTSTDNSNSHIPNADGPPNMIAPFWEDLSPQQPGGHVCYYFNSTQHYFVVEYDSVRQYAPTTARETFQIVLYDPGFYPTSTGDGQILFQYKKVTDPTSCTVGIENQAQTVGIEYLYNTDYSPNAAHLGAGMAILFSTRTTAPQLDVTLTIINPPIVIPANGGNFGFNVYLLNGGPSQIPYWVWTRVKYPDGSYSAPQLGPVNINTPVGVTITRQRSQTVPASWPSGVYTYLGYANTAMSYPAVDSSWFTFTKSATANGGPVVLEAICSGELFPGEIASVSQQPATFSLEQNRPNPFNPSTAISYQLQTASQTKLTVYDTAGRLITTLVDEMQGAGTHSVTFDGSKLASGLYFVRMEAGDFNAVQKMMLLK